MKFPTLAGYRGATIRKTSPSPDWTRPANGRNHAAAARNCLAYLRPGGNLRIAVPDGLFPDPAYIERVKVGADGHQVLYTYDTLDGLLQRAGFRTSLLEYFDEGGVFHENPWSPDLGLVRRSKAHDARNRDGLLTYTSIIIDARKP